jgi:cation transport regulator ChaB
MRTPEEITASLSTEHRKLFVKALLEMHSSRDKQAFDRMMNAMPEPVKLAVVEFAVAKFSEGELEAKTEAKKAAGKAIRRDALEILKTMIQAGWGQTTQDGELVERAVKMAQKLTDLT